MRWGRVGVSVARARLLPLTLLVVVMGCVFDGPARAGLQEVYSGEMASCAGGGIDVDLAVTGTVTGVEVGRASSRVEVRVEEVLHGDEGESGGTLSVRSNLGTNGGDVGAVGLREGGRYRLYLQRSGDEWATNVCMGTREIAAPPTSPTVPETGGPSVLPILAFAGLLILGAGALVRRRAR
ncbi:LPXTG cell wall anchor domain-containing protein [Rubrobacter marinus]|uniref:LPXTG cell wall anchor domain-containing protein n=1 Tax=Rubrobacter marinus TaxID=2653852 RepID=A0A6G8PZ65_9ACTN|nr:LPXTG cell wall anchor domain-containing protein [Rubrobacter marinus]QIN79496.1 LPXTG cell wall anchor domain-containing protein [Rubrobacter marinus]